MSVKFETPALQDLYSLNHGFFTRSLDRMPDDYFSKSNLNGKPSFQWIAAHLTNTKCRAANKLGADFGLPWDDLVGGMDAVYKEGKSYPSKKEILEIWNPVTNRFLELLTRTADVQLEQEVDFGLPGVPQNVQGLLSFLCFHESYHVGQLGMLVSVSGGNPLAKPD